MLGGRIDWPWGKAVCQSKLEVKREALVKAMTEAEIRDGLAEQKVRCTLAQKIEGEPYAVDISIAPKVTFENGKAVIGKAQLGRGEGAMLAYALIYAGTGLDNSANVLGPEVARMVNEFTTKMRQLKDDMPEARATTRKPSDVLSAPIHHHRPHAHGHHVLQPTSARCSAMPSRKEAHGVPGVLLPLVILTEAGGGLCVLLGLFTRWWAIALAGFCVLAAFFFHWHPEDQMQMINFMKNITITGGFLVLAGAGPGALSRWTTG